MPKHTDLAHKIRDFLVADLKDSDVILISEVDRLMNASDMTIELRNGKTLTVSVIDNDDA